MACVAENPPRGTTKGAQMRARSTTLLAVLTAVAVAVTASGPVAAVPVASAAGAACAGNGARVADGATAQEPALYPDNEANAYGVIKDSPRLPNGSVTVPTVFHMISDHPLTAAQTSRFTTMITAQMEVLNDSYAGRTAPDASDTPFRFSLVGTARSCPCLNSNARIADNTATADRANGVQGAHPGRADHIPAT